MIDWMADYAVASWVVLMFLIALMGQGFLLLLGLKHLVNFLIEWFNPPKVVNRFERDDNDYEQY